MATISNASFQQRSLAARGGAKLHGKGLPNQTEALKEKALTQLINSFEHNPSLNNIPPEYTSNVAERLPVDLDVRLTVPNVHSETYYKRVLAAYGESFGAAVDIAHHGGSYKQAFCELYVANLLERFGSYDHSASYEKEFTRQPIDSSHPRWGEVYLKAPAARADGLKARERSCAGAVAGEDLDSRILASPDSGWPYLEALKASVKADMPNYEAGYAWQGLDLKGQGAKAQAIVANGGPLPPPAPAAAADPKKKEAAPADASAPTLPEVPAVLSVPYPEAAEQSRRDALLLALAQDDVGDSAVEAAGAFLREWVDPEALASWRATGKWPATRGDSLLTTRAKELGTLLERIAACEDHVFRLNLKALPSHLDLELVTSRLPNLTALSLSYGVGEAGVRFTRPSYGMAVRDMECLGRALRVTDSLTSLALTNVGLDDAALAVLVAAMLDNSSVTSLDLSANGITASGTELLAKLLRGGAHGCVLTVLSLADNAIGPQGGTWLARALRNNDTLVSLDVHMNDLGDAGAAAIGAALGRNATLQRLHLGSTGAGAATAASLSSSVASPACGLEVLDVSGNDLDGPALALLATGAGSSGSLVSLDLRGNPGLDSEDGRAALEVAQAACRTNEGRRRGGLQALVPAYTAVVRGDAA